MDMTTDINNDVNGDLCKSKTAKAAFEKMLYYVQKGSEADTDSNTTGKENQNNFSRKCSNYNVPKCIRVQNTHIMAKDGTLSHQHQTNYSCLLCGKFFPKLDHLLKHAQYAQMYPCNDTAFSNGIYCCFCGMALPSRLSLNLHQAIKLSTSVQGEKSDVKPLCPLCFEDNIMHEDEIMFSIELKSHLKVIHGWEDSSNVRTITHSNTSFVDGTCTKTLYFNATGENSNTSENLRRDHIVFKKCVLCHKYMNDKMMNDHIIHKCKARGCLQKAFISELKNFALKYNLNYDLLLKLELEAYRKHWKYQLKQDNGKNYANINNVDNHKTKDNEDISENSTFNFRKRAKIHNIINPKRKRLNPKSNMPFNDIVHEIKNNFSRGKTLIDNQIEDSNVLLPENQTSECTRISNADCRIDWLPPDIVPSDISYLLNKSNSFYNQCDNESNFRFRLFCLWKLHLNMSFKNYISNINNQGDLETSSLLPTNLNNKCRISEKRFADTCAKLYHNISRSLVDSSQPFVEKTHLLENKTNHRMDGTTCNLFQENWVIRSKQHLRGNLRIEGKTEIPKILAVKRVLEELQCANIHM